MEYEWEESYTQVIRTGSHKLFFGRLFICQNIQSLVIISPWIGRLKQENLGYSVEDIARFINRHQIPTFVITRDPKKEIANREAIDILLSCPSLTLYYNNSLHAKIYVCRCIPSGFALLSSANLSMSSLNMVEIGLLIEGKGYGREIVEELDLLGREDLLNRAGTYRDPEPKEIGFR